MNINEVCRGLVFRDADLQKAKQTGTVDVRLIYQDGGIMQSFITVQGPLIPGKQAPTPDPRDHDVRGKNMG